MPRKPPPAPPKGTRHPGAGRKPGTPNHITVEARTLVSQLVNDPRYQHRLRTDFKRRKVHPTIESLIWQYHIGKPTQSISVSGSMALDVSGRLEEERKVFAQLDLADLEQLAAESQALVDRAMALAKTAGNGSVNALAPLDVVVEAEAPEQPSESLANQAGPDNTYYVNPADPSSSDDNPQ